MTNLVGRGQMNPQVRFLSRAPGYTVFLTSTEAVLGFRTPRETEASGKPAASQESASPASLRAYCR